LNMFLRNKSVVIVLSLDSPTHKGVSWEKPSVEKYEVNGNKGKKFEKTAFNKM
jgi:hypothetical protein